MWFIFSQIYGNTFDTQVYFSIYAHHCLLCFKYKFQITAGWIYIGHKSKRVHSSPFNFSLYNKIISPPAYLNNNQLQEHQGCFWKITAMLQDWVDMHFPVCGTRSTGFISLFTSSTIIFCLLESGLSSIQRWPSCWD